jgi:pyruvate/2-oxoglutarate dehydrogenase complex dihydrolipoamide dehydrogenase (E3) component
METRRFDFIILGSGSTAFAAAIRAAELGKTVAMTENRTLGGTCVNRGCLPSKNLIAAAGIVHDATHPRYPGIEPARLKVNLAETHRAEGRSHRLLPGEKVSEHRLRLDFDEGTDVLFPVVSRSASEQQF